MQLSSIPVLRGTGDPVRREWSGLRESVGKTANSDQKKCQDPRGRSKIIVFRAKLPEIPAGISGFPVNSVTSRTNSGKCVIMFQVHPIAIFSGWPEPVFLCALCVYALIM